MSNNVCWKDVNKGVIRDVWPEAYLFMCKTESARFVKGQADYLGNMNKTVYFESFTSETQT